MTDPSLVQSVTEIAKQLTPGTKDTVTFILSTVTAIGTVVFTGLLFKATNDMAKATIQMKEATEKSIDVAKASLEATKKMQTATEAATEVSKQTLEFNKLLASQNELKEKDVRGSFRLFVFAKFLSIQNLLQDALQNQLPTQLLELNKISALPTDLGISKNELASYFSNDELPFILKAWEQWGNYISRYIQHHYNYNDGGKFLQSTQELQVLVVGCVAIILNKN